MIVQGIIKYIRLVNIKGCAGEYIQYSLPCVFYIVVGLVWVGGEKYIAMELEFIDLKWLHSSSFFNFVRWVSCQSSTRGLRKLGYMLEMKVDFSFGFFQLFWWHIGTYCLNMATSNLFPHNVVTWAFFSQEVKVLCIILTSTFFGPRDVKSCWKIKH